jgi:hypothetical protein
MMNACQKVKHLIVLRAISFGGTEDVIGGQEINAGTIDDIYDRLCDAGLHWDAMGEVREGEFETTIPCQYSRHYESKSVASRLPDGSWVGWTYWYGGGKHGKPEAINWIEEAYDLTVTEEEKMVTVRTFARAPEAA